jgi:hypothetical protein
VDDGSREILFFTMEEGPCIKYYPSKNFVPVEENQSIKK